LHDAGHRVGAVDGALGAAHDFQALDVVHGRDAEIVKAAGIVDRYSVDEHLVEVGVTAANEQAGLAAAASAGVHDGPGNVAEGIGGGMWIEQRELLAAEQVERHRCLVHRVGCGGCGHHHGLRRGGHL
jgi:hypothetical protein